MFPRKSGRTEDQQLQVRIIDFTNILITFFLYRSAWLQNVTDSYSFSYQSPTWLVGWLVQCLPPPCNDLQTLNMKVLILCKIVQIRKCKPTIPYLKYTNFHVFIWKVALEFSLILSMSVSSFLFMPDLIQPHFLGHSVQ